MHLFELRNIVRAGAVFALSVAAMVVTPTEAGAQDLIAKQAPIDRKMKVVDSVAINKALKRHVQREVVYEENDLYTTWDTNRVHCYGNQTAPEKYRIDLRGFAMPTPSRVVTSNYGYRASFGRMHKGIDVKVYIGDTIVSAFDGKVRVVDYEGKGYGNYVVIRHSNGLETIYGHLSKHLCRVGDVVKAGQPIGLGGNTGRSTGSHLHFETRLLGEAINPALLFDFVHQDVTGDFYDYRRSKSSSSTPARQQIAAAEPKEATRPEAETPAVKAKAEETANNSRKGKSDGKAIASAKKQDKAKSKKKPKSTTYTVKKGDTLYGIANRAGISVKELCARNKIDSKSTLQLGQTIRY